MTNTDLYEFRTKGYSTLAKASPRDLKLYSNRTSDWWMLAKGNFDNIAFPVIFDKYEGNKFTDVMETGMAVLFLISDKMKAVLEDNKLTGWKLYPIKIFDKKGNSVEGYHGFSVVGKSGPVDYTKSTVIYRQFVPSGPFVKYFIGKYIDPKTWDGSDFFQAGDTCNIYLTSNAAKILRKTKLTNIQLRKLSEIEVAEHALS